MIDLLSFGVDFWLIELIGVAMRDGRIDKIDAVVFDTRSSAAVLDNGSIDIMVKFSEGREREDEREEKR